MALSIGDAAPSLNSLDQHANSVSPDLNQLTVLYFYPKDDTPGCTKESCEFRDQSADYANVNAQIIGVSTDDASSHKDFAEKYNLNFTLLDDVSQDISTAYGVLRENGFANRVTFLIKGGTIQHVFDPVNPVGHSQEVLNVIQTLK